MHLRRLSMRKTRRRQKNPEKADRRIKNWALYWHKWHHRKENTRKWGAQHCPLRARAEVLSAMSGREGISMEGQGRSQCRWAFRRISKAELEVSRKLRGSGAMVGGDDGVNWTWIGEAARYSQMQHSYLDLSCILCLLFYNYLVTLNSVGNSGRY